jgi:hypothetical protein
MHVSVGQDSHGAKLRSTENMDEGRREEGGMKVNDAYEKELKGY